MTKVKSKEFISSGSDSDSDDDLVAEKERKAEKRKSTDADLELDSTSKKQKTDSDDEPKKKKPEKVTKKKGSDSDSDSSDEEAKKQKAKKQKKKKSKRNSDSEEEKPKKKEKKQPKKATGKPEGNARKGFDLGRDRKISVSEFKGRKYVNIREYYDAGGGEMKPGKKGISLSREQWDMFTQVKDDVNKAVASDEKFFELGRNKRVSLMEFKGMVLFDIREYYEKDEVMKPGKKGIALSREQWEMVHAVTDEITDAII